MSIWTKNQHFIPQAYLRLFSHNQKNIWVYDSIGKTIKSQSIKDTGLIKFFYLSKLHPAPLDVPAVSELEGCSKVIIKRIEAGQEVSPTDLGQLLNFIILQFLRTPAAKIRIESSLVDFWQGLRKRYREVGSTDINFRQKAEAMAQSFMSDQKISGVSPQIFLDQDIGIAVPTEFFPQAIATVGEILMPKLADQGWEFLFAGDQEEFLTSDDPFTFADGEKRTKIPSMGKDMMKIIPLSRKVCLAIGGERRPIVSKKMQPWATKVINLGIASVADRYIYSSNEVLLERTLEDLPKFIRNPDAFVEVVTNI